MNRPILIVALLVTTLIAGCTSLSTETGEFELLVSDQPAAIGDFSSLDVTLSESRIFPDNTTNETYETLAIDNRTVDLTTLLGTNASSLINTSLEAGTYEKIELHVADATGVVDGQQTDVMVPSEKLQITNTFTISANRTTTFVFDIHVVRRGQGPGAGGYILRPVISESGVVGDDVEEPDRVGRPADAGTGPAQ